MGKILVIYPNKCASCRNCELACSFAHDKVFNPNKSRVHALVWERLGLGIPLMCMQCEDAACVKVCPTNATYRDAATGAVIWEKEKCIGCKLCVSACPFGNTTYDVEEKRIIKCDLCDGDPQCVKFCPNGAIEFIEADEANMGKKRIVAEKFKALFTEEVK